VTNIVLHGVASMLVVALVYLLLSCRPSSSSSSSSSSSEDGAGQWRVNEVALMSGLLFACHPVHVEAVTGIVLLDEKLLVAIVFTFLCFCVFCVFFFFFFAYSPNLDLPVSAFLTTRYGGPR
jgi:hypothetical protein